MSRVFDQLKSLRKGKEDTPKGGDKDPSFTTLKDSLNPKAGKTMGRKRIIMWVVIGVPILLAGFFVPRILLKPAPVRKLAPVYIPPKPAQEAPKPTPAEAPVVEEITLPTILSLAAIEEIPLEEKAAPVVAEALSIEVLELKPAGPPSIEITPITPPETPLAEPPAPKVAEAPRIEIRAVPPKEPERPPTKPEPPVAETPKVAVAPEPLRGVESKRPTPAVPTLPPTLQAPVPPPPPEEEMPPEEEIPIPTKKIDKGERFKLAVFYQKSGELKKALEQYAEIVKIDPMDAEVHNNLGSIYQEWEDYERAIQSYRKAILLKPNYYKARNNLGVALYKKGNLEGALREFQTVIEANPRDIQGLTNLGVVLKKLGEPSRARQFFEKAISISPSHVEAHYNLALILEEQGEVANAIYHYQKFLEFSGGRYASLTEEVMKHLEGLSGRSLR